MSKSDPVWRPVPRNLLGSAAILLVLVAAASFASPFLATPVAQLDEKALLERQGQAMCGIGGCGFGLDGFPEPFVGPGIAGAPGLVAARAALQFDSSGVRLLSWLTTRDLNGSPTAGSDIWGYVSPSGREYAIVGLQRGTAFVDITRPNRPDVLQVIKGGSSAWRDMAVYDEFAYSVNERGDGLQVIDLRDIDAGNVKLRQNLQQSGLETSHNVFVNEQSGYLYLLGSNLSRGGLVAVDLADPLNPVIEPINWNVTYVHDVQVVTLKKGKNAGREIAFAFTGPMGLHIIDVTDKANPKTISNLRYKNATYGHSGALAPSYKFLYINDELDERSNATVKQLTTYVVKVKNLAKPRLLRAVVQDTEAIDHNSMVAGTNLYMSAYTAGLRVMSIKNRKRPRVTGFFDTYPADDSATFTGAWGVFAGFPSGNVIVSDVERGLFVLRAKS